MIDADLDLANIGDVFYKNTLELALSLAGSPIIEVFGNSQHDLSQRKRLECYSYLAGFERNRTRSS